MGDEIIGHCESMLDSIRLCIHLSNFSHDHIARSLGIDNGHWTRIMQGRGNLPARKRTLLMSICGNLAPLQYDSMKFGFTLSREDLDEQERQAELRLQKIRDQKRMMEMAA